MGCISGLGIGKGAFWEGLMRAQTAVQPLLLSAGQHQTTMPGVRVPGYDPHSHFSPDDLLLRDRYAQFAIICAREALHDAGLSAGEGVPGDTAVILGSGGGGEHAREE